MQAAFDAMERVSVRSADLLWGPSDYLLNDMRSTGWRLPGRVECRQLVMPTAELFRPDAAKFEHADTPPPRRSVQRIEEIVFFGRLEQRKGLQLFCEALDRLDDRLVVCGISVTFLGKAVWQDGEKTDDWLRARAQSWRFPWQLKTDLGQPEAVSYLRRAPVIAVMPSPVDNSPCTIYEAIQNGIPFLASATGGIPELIDPEDHWCTLFDYTVEGIETALVRALDAGVATARPRVSQAANRNQWRTLHHDWRGYLPIAPGSGPAVHVVVLVQHAEVAATRRTLRSVRQVLGDRLAGIILLTDSPVSDGFPGTEIISRSGLSGAAIARAIERTAAPWVLCVLGGVELQSDALPLVERALAHPEIGAGLIPAARFKGRIVPPMGSAPAFGEFEDYLYTGGGVFAVAPVLDALRAIGDTTTEPFAGLIGRIVAAGGELWPFAEPFLALDRPPLPAVQRAGLFDHSRLAEAGMIRAVQCTADGRPKSSRPRQLLLRFADSPAFPLAHPLAARLARFEARFPQSVWFSKRALWFAKRVLRFAKRALRFGWRRLRYFGDRCRKL